jgi:hypothetical protein
VAKRVESMAWIALNTPGFGSSFCFAYLSAIL